MSEGEKCKGILEEIEEIYVFLTKGEPSPDDEIDSRDLLINLFKKLSENPPIPEQKDLIKDILKKLEDWDTLDLWFLETSIPNDIEQILSITSKDAPSVQEKEEKSEEPPSLKKEDKVQKLDIDIGEIVDKVSQQFKGEIEGLKDTIENLKKELDKKDEAIKEISVKRRVQKITPKKEVRLPPPKIKIPVIKKPVIKSKEQLDESIPQIPPEPPMKKPSQVQKPLEKDKQSLTPIPLKPAELEPKKTNENDLTPIPVKKPKIISTVIEESKDKPFVTEKTKVSTVFKKNDGASLMGDKHDDNTAFSVEKPRISSVRIEEAEKGSIKSSSLDLFDVLSAVGEGSKPKTEKKVEKISEKIEIKKFPEFPENETKIENKVEKPRVNSFVDFNSLPNSSFTKAQEQISDELPDDKDALYQELIALEGRRYSIEKRVKELETSYNKGSISDIQYKSSNEEIEAKMQEITTRINTIRRLISSL